MRSCHGETCSRSRNKKKATKRNRFGNKGVHLYFLGYSRKQSLLFRRLYWYPTNNRLRSKQKTMRYISGDKRNMVVVLHLEKAGASIDFQLSMGTSSSVSSSSSSSGDSAKAPIRSSELLLLMGMMDPRELLSSLLLVLLDFVLSRRPVTLECNSECDSSSCAMICSSCSFSLRTSSSGSDDIFVAQLQGASGSLNWIRQVGSSEKDTLAHGDGLAVDAMGNAVLW